MPPSPQSVWLLDVEYVPAPVLCELKILTSMMIVIYIHYPEIYVVQYSTVHMCGYIVLSHHVIFNQNHDFDYSIITH